MTLRDPDIRPLVLARLQQPHTLVVQEWKIESDASVIADVAAIGERSSSSYEIKSDADSLARLARQVPLYGAAFDFCWLIVAARHRARAVPALPSWWGVLMPDEGTLIEERGAALNPDARPERLLWAKEIKALVQRFDLRAAALQHQHDYYAALSAKMGFNYGKGPAKPGKWHMLAALATVPREVLTPMVCKMLHERKDWRRPDGYHVNREQRRRDRSYSGGSSSP